MVRSRSFAALIIALAALALTAPGFTSGIDAGRGIAPETSRADELYAEGSYRLAHEAYDAIEESRLDEEQRRWLSFRLADTLWRSETADDRTDPSEIERARRELRGLLEPYQTEREKDELFAAIHESLGDSWWNMAERNWSTAWNHYNTALEYWAGSTDLDHARERYIDIVRSASDPPRVQPWESYGHYVNSVPIPIIDNAVEIARSPEDQAYTSYLLGMRLRHASDPKSVERGTIAFERAIETGRGTAWYDDALFAYAQTLEQRGRLQFRNGKWTRVPDPEGALTLYRRLTSEYSKGQTRYYDQAAGRIQEITSPSLNLSVSNVFLPGSEIPYQIHWRNIDSVEVALWRVDLTRDLQLTNGNTSTWIQEISLAGAKRVASETRSLATEGAYLPGSETVRLGRDLDPGAYLLVGHAGTREARELILVTDVAVVTKTSSEQILVFGADARTGKPVSGARVRVWEEFHDGRRIRHRSYDSTTGSDGVAMIERSAEQNGRQILVTLSRGDRQAFSLAWSYSAGGRDDQWRIYAETDRPAYRPEETVNWKVTARTMTGGDYATPAGRQLGYEIHDPRGNKTSEGNMTLNEFGSAWSELELDETMPLGVYMIRFREPEGDYVGAAQLFRLEEYKLPEFRVSVTPAQDDAEQPKRLRLGDEVEVEIDASYYFGGPVANATVEVVVHQKPYYPDWRWPRAYPWYFEQAQRHVWYGQGQEVLRETLTTGPDGTATFTFDTPDQGQDLEYTVEARVTDASRREIIGSATIRVSGQPFYAHMRPEGFLHRPGDRVEIDLRTVDANERPVQAEGELVVTRDSWVEVWLSPKGRKVAGSELESVRSRVGIFPPPQEPGEHPWTLISRGYEHEEVAQLTLSTDEQGDATYRFEPRREGFYRFKWTSRVADESSVRPRDIVSAETTVWIADRSTRSLGYHSSGVELIFDDSSFRSGSTTPVMIVTESPGSHVLFTIERESILDHRVIETRGNVTLLELEIDDRHIPNVFLSASMVRDLQLAIDTKEAIVPPVEHFLDVTVELDEEEYQPRDRGTVTVKVLDHEGRPVQSQLSLAVVDESVFYIQEELSGDPRQFFYGDKQGNYVQTMSSFQQKAYVRLVEGEDGGLVDERQVPKRERRQVQIPGAAMDEVADLERAAVGGVVGGRQVEESVTMQAAAPAAPAAMKSASMALEQDAAAPQAAEAVVVRSDFRSTAFWAPDIVTDEDGTATVEVKWPDSLTTWRATARVATTGADFGIARSEARTKKPLIVRLQAPRFFVVGDEVVVSAIVNNNTDHELEVTPEIEIDGLELVASIVDGERISLNRSAVDVEAGGEKRLDWVVAASDAGTATVRVQALGDGFSDAMERSYEVWEHGIEKLVASSGKVHGNTSLVRIDLPERRAGSTEMSVTVTPSIAITMLDAIPYLVHYPYGCTEQTMSRFLPAAIVAKTLEELGVPRETVASRVFGGIEPDSADATHPKGKQDLAKLDDVMEKGLARLYDFQHGDGGWGWWKEGESDHFMTAYVVWGLTLANDAGIEIRSGVLDRAVTWLDRELVEEETDVNRQAWMLHAVTAASPGRTNDYRDRAFTNLWSKRDELTSYGRALLALSAHQLGRSDEAATLVRNLENGVRFDASPDQSVVLGARDRRSDDVMATAHWGTSERFWWRWYEGPVETTAFVLRALVTIDPDHRLVEPAMNWLVRNRRGAQWNNTRDTAITILGLNEYLERSGELKGNASYEISVNDETIGGGVVTPATMFTARSRFEVPLSAVRDGRNTIRIVRTGGTSDQPLYFSVEATFFSLEEPVTAEGNEIFVRREYYRLVPRETLLKGYEYERVPLRDGASIQSGERVDVVVTIETKNDYEYLVFEDLKPAGFEAVQIRSGERLFARQLRSDATERQFAAEDANARHTRGLDSRGTTGRTEWIHQELRDRKVVMFASKLDQGVWEIRYTLRAEVPGAFHALPLLGEAMYVPEIRANSEEIRVTVEDR